jgi:3-oxoacyl-[acyl-carrier-protein] synthase II
MTVSPPPPQRVFISGLGPLCSLGDTTEKLWANLLAGRSFVRHVDELGSSPVTIGAPVEDPSLSGCSVRERRYDRSTLFALVASRAALRDAELVDSLGAVSVPSPGFGVVLGTSRGATGLLEAFHERFLERGAPGVPPHASPLTTTGNLSAVVARHLGLRGPNLTVSAACASATQAIGVAFDAVRHGRAELMLAGGAEACLTPFCIAMLDAAKILSHRSEPPAAAVRPFDRDRDGLVLAEGAGVVVVESERSLRRRGARAYAEVLGFGSSCDAQSLTGVPEDAEGLVRAIREALRDAGLSPALVDYVNAHATGTRVGDRAESRALETVFAAHAPRLAISAIKSMTGHLLGGSGGIEAIATALAISQGEIPPTVNLDHADPDCRLDYTPWQSRRLPVRVALKTSMGFGGNNACLALGRVSGNDLRKLPRDSTEALRQGE